MSSAPRPAFLRTTDPRRIGRALCGMAAFFGVVGGIEAMFLRVQWMVPASDFLAGETVHRLLTMHGVTMVWLVLLPFWNGLALVVAPLQIGARELAFPRLAACAFWLWLIGAGLLHAWWPLGGFAAAPAFGWTGGPAPPPGAGSAAWAVGVGVIASAQLGLATTLVTTILRGRAPGLGWLRLPAFANAVLWSQWLAAFVASGVAASAFGVALELALSSEPTRSFPDWARGMRIATHPEIYLLILPAFGVIGDIVAVATGRAPLTGPLARACVAALGLFGIASLAFGAGAPGIPAAPLASAAIVGVWALATLLDVLAGVRTLRARAAFGYAVFAWGLLGVGGMIGFVLSQTAPDSGLRGTAVTVGHLHLVLSGAALLAAFGAITHWWPKLAGRVLRERVAWLHAVTVGLGALLTFGALAVGVALPRRALIVASGPAAELSTFASLASFLLAGTLVIFVWNVWTSRRRAAPPDPWDGGTLEWATPSPPPADPFPRTPLVSSAFPFWTEKRETAAVDRRARHWGPPTRETRDERPGWAPLVVAAGLGSIGFGSFAAAGKLGGALGPGFALGGLLLVGVGLGLWVVEARRQRLFPAGPADGGPTPE